MSVDIALGPRCRHCPRNEAQCAREGRCCIACTHTFGEDNTRTAVCRDCQTTFTHAVPGRPPLRCESCRFGAKRDDREDGN